MWTYRNKTLFLALHTHQYAPIKELLGAQWQVLFSCTPSLLSTSNLPGGYSVCKWFKKIWIFRNTLNSCETTLYDWFTQSTSGSNRFDTFETHQIHVKRLLSLGRTDSKVSNHIVKPLHSWLTHSKSGSDRFETFKTHCTRVKPLTDQHYKVVSHEFNVLRKFRICSNH